MFENVWRRIEPESFGVAYDLLFLLTEFSCLWCALLVVYFDRYQQFENDFQPWLYGTIGLLMLLLYYIRSHMCNGILCVLAELLLAAGYVQWIPVQGSKMPLLLAVVAVLVNEFVEYQGQRTDVKRFAGRYKKNRRQMVFGVLILGMILYQYYASGEVAELSVSPDVCIGYMMSCFGLFLLSMIMLIYTYVGYEHFRKKVRNTKDAKRQFGRSTWLMGIVVSLLIVMLLLICTKPLTEVVSWCVSRLVYVVLGVLFAIFPPGTELEQQTMEKELMGPEGAIGKLVPTGSLNLGGILTLVLMLVFAALVGWGLYFLYKKFFANYKTGEDVVEFIAQDNGQYEFEKLPKKMRRTYGNTPAEVIRHQFYKAVWGNRGKVEKNRLNYYTGQECTELFEQRQKGSFKRLVALYYKARYSETECTTEDAENAVKEYKSL